MTPGPNTPMNVLKNEPINMFVFLNEKFNGQDNTIIQMHYFDSITNTTKNEEIVIKKEDFYEGDTI
jgi:hypothetical protein